MSRSKIIGLALLHALATTAYVYLVVRLMNFMNSMNLPDKQPFAPIGFLLLFVISASITASLVFGRPLMWYLDKRKREALAFAMYTITWLVIIMLFVFSLILNIS